MSKIEPIKHTLIDPVTIVDGSGEREITEVVFPRKAKGKDFAAQDLVQGKMMQTFAMYASMCGEPIQVFEEMSIEDFTEIGMKVMPLMGKRGQKAAMAEMEKRGLGTS